MTEDKYAALREDMVKYQIERRGITKPELLAVLRQVPRHLFVPGDVVNMAYEDGPLPIGSEQTISQPYIVALMTSLLALEGDENVLEVGTGSGYQAAILAGLVKTVHTIERHQALADRSQKILNDLGIDNVFVHVGDGSKGWIDAAPYKAVIITAAAPKPPEPILQQMDEGARLVLPVGARGSQELQLWKREGEHYSSESIIPVAFVPLRGEHGWDAEKWNGLAYN